MSDIDANIKKQIVEEKIQQLKIKQYEEEINLKIAETVGNEDGVKTATEIINSIEKVIAVLEAE